MGLAFLLACGDGSPRRLIRLGSLVETGETYVEDVKGVDTTASRLRRAVVEAEYGIRIVIVR